MNTPFDIEVQCIQHRTDTVQLHDDMMHLVHSHTLRDNYFPIVLADTDRYNDHQYNQAHRDTVLGNTIHYFHSLHDRTCHCCVDSLMILLHKWELDLIVRYIVVCNFVPTS